ncbi:hypothetical protein [Paenibacillus dauci]|uniref:hypothetical protein n=1 Tax=Paenibacillus dauci TaxID=1567106 RepID=UPI0006199181|nr:hypothetical protein [Paenibacillus dauci]
MGCDITLFCEGYLWRKWINIDSYYRSDDWAEYMVTEDQGFIRTSLLNGVRDYGLFFLLAGVRGDGDKESYLPLDFVRGIPDDMDQLIRKRYEEDYDIDFDKEENGDYHHASYFTLKELKDSGYGDIMPLQGWVEPDDYAKHEEWMANGRRYQLPFIDVRCGQPDNENLILKEWNGYLNLNFTDLIEEMEKMKKERMIRSDEEIRIIFWFDN